MNATVQTKPVGRTTGVLTRTGPQRKSKTTIFWEKNPNGIIKVLDRRAVNK